MPNYATKQLSTAMSVVLTAIVAVSLASTASVYGQDQIVSPSPSVIIPADIEFEGQIIGEIPGSTRLIYDSGLEQPVPQQPLPLSVAPAPAQPLYTPPSEIPAGGTIIYPPGEILGSTRILYDSGNPANQSYHNLNPSTYPTDGVVVGEIASPDIGTSSLYPESPTPCLLYTSPSPRDRG